MNPKTGEILAMATYPSYNLNDPFTITTEETENPESSENPENVEDPEVQKANRKAMLENLWKDRNFSSTYEPGSTFKLIVAAAALEEEITDTDINNDFHCEGYTIIEDTIEDDIKIGCAQYAVHGNQTLRGALRNSCNAAFIQLGSRIGKETLYKYFEAFGLFEKTGVKVAGESSSRFHELDKVGKVELAITSFGQRFEITPVQLITAISAIANDGELIQPRIVKKVVNTDSGAVEEYDTKEVRKVISTKTAKELRDMMKSVVENRENIYGTVAGYSIGGKTGTSEPSTSRPEDGYVVSYTAIAPADEPEVVGLVVVYNVNSENAYGSRIAAPIMSNILTDVLPYMGIASEKSDTSNVTVGTMKTNKVTDVTNKTLTEAKKTLENLGFKVISAETQNANSVLVTEQVPAKDTVVSEGATIVLYTEENNVRTSVEVPNLIGKTLIEAKSALSDKDLNISYSGSGKVKSQDIRRTSNG
ncbi:MAG: PASTA domain-containing protein [Clostridia bacterium]|nr:PASTA domain-containing protein [Clostridia bacterium]